jgi:hypothetical protein
VQRQLPDTHCSDTLHAASDPHWQVPCAHVLVWTASHVTHSPPFLPQAAVDQVLQVPPEQQPLRHEVLSQTQLPPRQRWPTEQTGPTPHWQLPLVEQLSARTELQATHTLPNGAQAEVLIVLHVEPEQQPLGQLNTSQPAQAPETQLAAQVWQASPALPHAAAVLPAMHTLPEQHPVGQERPSQTQAPPRQRCPAPHDDPDPQTQAPLAEQPSASSGSHAWHVAPPTPQAAELDV